MNQPAIDNYLTDLLMLKKLRYVFVKEEEAMLDKLDRNWYALTREEQIEVDRQAELAVLNGLPAIDTSERERELGLPTRIGFGTPVPQI